MSVDLPSTGHRKGKVLSSFLSHPSAALLFGPPPAAAHQRSSDHEAIMTPPCLLYGVDAPSKKHCLQDHLWVQEPWPVPPARQQCREQVNFKTGQKLAPPLWLNTLPPTTDLHPPKSQHTGSPQPPTQMGPEPCLHSASTYSSLRPLPEKEAPFHGQRHSSHLSTWPASPLASRPPHPTAQGSQKPAMNTGSSCLSPAHICSFLFHFVKTNILTLN